MAGSSQGSRNYPPSPSESSRVSSASPSPEPQTTAENQDDRNSACSDTETSVAKRTAVRRRRSINREREPPKNDQGQIYCDHADCASKLPTFQRRCEWKISSKHMDKHERPYRCGEIGCEKLRGFTYSGGLLRHEREVHGKHGGLKKPLMCPYENCKRSSGAGFTRQENLNEHLRRVHQKVEKTEPASEPLVESPAKKRKRSEEPDEEALDSPSTKKLLEDLQQEVKRLRTENAEMKAELREYREKLFRLLKGG
ncbi:MAG: hypothetical protein M1816_001819 [Peltula sp. TS41687]|nr:MAG: hypothetical protein M1816_001819 [Peltula sp. TS41687]